MTAAGALRHRVTLQQRVYGSDAAGQPVSIWVDVATVWAKRTNMLSTGAESISQGVEAVQQPIRFDIRPRVVDTSWRIRDAKGYVYDIKSVGTDNANAVTTVLAVANADQVPAQTTVSGGGAADAGPGLLYGGTAGDADAQPPGETVIAGGNAADPGPGVISGGRA